MENIDNLNESPKLEDICKRMEVILYDVFKQEKDKIGIAIASTYYQLLRDYTFKHNEKSKIALQCLEQKLPKVYEKKKAEESLGSILHTFMLQFASLYLKLSVMAENALNWLDGRSKSNISFENVYDLLKAFPALESTEQEVAEDLTVKKDLQSLWEQNQPYVGLKDYYLDLMSPALKKGQSDSLICFFVLQKYFHQYIPENTDLGELFSTLAKIWYKNIIKLEVWLENYMEKVENPKEDWLIRVHKRKSVFKTRKSFREIVTQYKKNHENE